ncbi:MAG: hypothetical protein MUF18_00635 [Fimbriiglobus sp.]|jgi:hypothetical protein|nr:hypothetical protein [Fimbriiglobus sp.]
MTAGTPPDRDECIEQAYFFRTLRERVQSENAAQDALTAIAEEVLTTTRLPMAIQFLASELRHTGQLATGFAKLPHYFTPFQRFVIRQSELDKSKFPFLIALQVLEREATYKSATPTPAGLFVYQIEAITRNRLGYTDGLVAMSEEPFFPADWRENANITRRQIGIVEFAELVYLRSEQYVVDRRRENPEYSPSLSPLFGEKEGRIAKASRGRDPLFLFAALQRQLGYPEVPKPAKKDDAGVKLELLERKVRDMDTRLRILEAETRGTFDPTQFGKPDMFRDIKDDDPPPA